MDLKEPPPMRMSIRLSTAYRKSISEVIDTSKLSKQSSKLRKSTDSVKSPVSPEPQKPPETVEAAESSSPTPAASGSLTKQNMSSILLHKLAEKRATFQVSKIEMPALEGSEEEEKSSSSSNRSSSIGSNKSVEEETLAHFEHGEDQEEEEEAVEAKESTESSYGFMDVVEEEEIEEEEIPFVSVFERLDVEREVLPYPDTITPEMLKAISVDLGQIRLCWPKKEKLNIDFMPNVILPDGYLMNTNKEKVLLLYCENFRVQYHARFPNRKPLLLCGDNVVGQRKMVCTGLRPTTLPHPDLSTWQELASFLADHIKYEPLDPPTKLKARLLSPHSVFTKKFGHSFEMSNALCSMLLGRNYQAYVVYGFATRDVTERIMVRIDCPFEEQVKEEEAEEEEQVTPKYVLRPPRDLRSKFLMAMEQKDAEKNAREKEKQEDVKRKKMLELEKPPYDDLNCRRIHGWVIMMPEPEEKDFTKPFFIEASTGMSHPVDSPLYCAIQSIWNNTNYWVNLQDDSLGTGNLSYDLTDISKWEHILPGEPIHNRVHERNLDLEEDEEAMELNRIMDEKHLDMPEPWSLRIHVTHEDVTNRFPSGHKTTAYKRTIVEQYSPYSQEDGLVMKIYRYSDIEYSNMTSIEERYRNRNDKWVKRTEDIATGLITEHFERGRDDNVKEHTFYKHDNDVDSWRQIEFYFKSRFDCLKLIDHDVMHLKEDYVQREDLFYYRHTDYAKRGEPPPGFIEGRRRIITNVVEKFERNKNVRASDDIASREFDYVSRKMSLQFHYDLGKITASTRVFLKPPLSEMVEGVSYRPELTYGYQAEIGAKPPKNSTLYALLEKQLKDEEESTIKVRHVEDSISEFIRCRALEVLYPKLDVGLFNREQNKENLKAMLEKEVEDRTKKEREIEEELDYIRPYLVRDNLGEVLTYSQALKVRNACLMEFKELMVKRANDLQKHFQAQIALLKNRREWYNEEVDNLTFEEEQVYFRELNQANFVMHCMELRLNRLKDNMPLRADALVRFLEMHPKLEALYRKKHRGVSVLKPKHAK